MERHLYEDKDLLCFPLNEGTFQRFINERQSFLYMCFPHILINHVFRGKEQGEETKDSPLFIPSYLSFGRGSCMRSSIH